MQASADITVDGPILEQRSYAPENPLVGAFTRYVEDLDPRREPDLAVFDEMWRALRNALVRELQRRSLWLSPPSFLGVYGWESWQSEEDGAGRRGSALEELLADCYAFIFLKRLPRLQAQLALKPNIDGFVFLYLRNYLHDRQKHHDPMGFRIFKVLRSAVREAVAGGELYVVAGDAKISNGTVLAVEEAEVTAAVSSPPGEIQAIVARWNDDLLPDLVTAGGLAYRQMLTSLRRRLLDLEASGIRTVRFKELADAVKNDVRQRWAALYDQGEGEALPDGEGDDASQAHAVRLVEPGTGFEDMESYVTLTGCVSESLERFDGPPRARRYLLTLWGFVRAYASDENEERLPSNRRLATLLRIPRERFPGLWRTLDSSIRSCQSALSGRVDRMGSRRSAGTLRRMS